MIIFTNTASKSIRLLLFSPPSGLTWLFILQIIKNAARCDQEEKTVIEINANVHFSCASCVLLQDVATIQKKGGDSCTFPDAQLDRTDSPLLNVRENSYNIVLIPTALVKCFIDLQSPRKRDVITCCKITGAISVHSAVNPLFNIRQGNIFWAGCVF